MRRIGWPMAPDATSPDLPGSFTAILLHVLPPWRAKV
jgi:hypothetical protein